ncbi:zinc ribbon domain-containing protein [Planctomycetota bacterium]|nr:zinc ribbon domain-containing protein [Planctomycetota bacterium]
MPNYTYRAADPEQGCGGCTEGFEELQKMSAPALTECPGCGTPVRRVIGAKKPVCVTGRRWDTKKMLSDDNLAAKGFQKLVKGPDGRYVDSLAGRKKRMGIKDPT